MKSTPVGYSINLAPNKHWREQGLICAYEHCIEMMDLPYPRTEGCCPVFGHLCPSGIGQIIICKEQEIELRVALDNCCDQTV